MVNCYLPAEGKYTVGGWTPKSSFTGPLQVVEDFATTAIDTRVQTVNAEANNAAMAQQFQNRVEAEARAEGRTPIRVSLPVKGKLFKLQKILGHKTVQMTMASASMSALAHSASYVAYTGAHLTF